MHQHTDSDTSSAEPDEYSLNGSSTAALQQRHVSKGLASFRASSAVVSQVSRQQTALQDAGQKDRNILDTVQNIPSWSRKLDWSKQVKILPQNGFKARNRQQQPRHTGAPQLSRQDLHIADQLSKLDNKLDFDNSNTQLLLRAYSSRAAAGRLDAALEVLEGVVAAGRLDVLTKWVAPPDSHSCKPNYSYCLHGDQMHGLTTG